MIYIYFFFDLAKIVKGVFIFGANRYLHKFDLPTSYFPNSVSMES